MRVFLIFTVIFYCFAQESPSPPKCTNLSTIKFPITSFNCWEKYDGYYADIEMDCTIFHYCQTLQHPNGLNESIKWDFACPENTIFNQRILSCTPPSFEFDCQKSENFFYVNRDVALSNIPKKKVETSKPFFENSNVNTGNHLTIDGPVVLPIYYPDSSILNDTKFFTLTRDSLETQTVNYSNKYNPYYDKEKNSLHLAKLNSKLHTKIAEATSVNLENSSGKKVLVLYPVALLNALDVVELH